MVSLGQVTRTLLYSGSEEFRSAGQEVMVLTENKPKYSIMLS